MRALLAKIPALYRWVGGILTTIGVIWVGTATTLADIKPIVDSGPLPLASRDEVKVCVDQVAQLSSQTSRQLVNLQKTQVQTSQQTNFLMRRALVDDYGKWQDKYAMAAAALRKNPKDPVAKALKDTAATQLQQIGQSLGLK